MITILNKVLAKEFYRLNAGFFLVIITLTFGFMSGVEHRALAEFFISSPIVLMIPITIWLLYIVKIANFNSQQIARQENQFIFEIALLPQWRQFLYIIMTLGTQTMPAILYAVFLFLIALKHHRYFPVTQIAASLLILILAASSLLFFQLNKTRKEIDISFLKKFFDYRFTKNIFQFYLEWLVRREPVMLIGTKIFTGLLIFAICQLYKGETYDWRLLAMGCTLAFSGNFMIIEQVHRFENSHFRIIRNLPIPILKRFLNYIIIFLLISLPEIIVLIKNYPHNLQWYYSIVIIFFGLSIGVIFYSSFYSNKLPEKDFTRIIFGSVISWIVLILFSMPLYLIVLFNFAIAMWLFWKQFYLFEFSSEEEKG